MMSKIGRDMAEANVQQEDFYRQPENALEIISEYTDVEFGDWEVCKILDFSEGRDVDPDYPRPNLPNKVVEVLETKYSGGFSGSKTFILAKVFCQDGVERIAEYHREYWTGSHMEPPEEDVELLWHDSIEKYHSSVEGKKGKV